MKVLKSENIPAKSTIAKGFGTIDYHDIYSVAKVTDKSAEEISKELMRLPDWVNILFFIRNRIVGLFGLKTDKNTSKSDTFFKLIGNRDEEIIMGEDDKHLNFRASILKDKTDETISLITVVHYNNVWGRYISFLLNHFIKS